MKKITKTIVVFVLVALLSVSFCNVSAFASTLKTTTSDDFDNSQNVGSVDTETWTASSSAIKTEEVLEPTYALKLGSAGGTEVQAALVSKELLTNLKTITFDIKCNTKQNWINIAFPKTREVLTTDNDGKPTNGEFNPYRMPSESGRKSIRPLGGVFKQNEWQSVKIEVLTANTCYIYITDKGKEFPTEPFTKDTGEPYMLADTDSFESCYFEMELNTSENRDTDPHVFVDNFKFESSDGTVWEENFESQTMVNLESIGATVTQEDGSTASYTPDHTIELVQGSNRLAFDAVQKGDFLKLNKKIEKNDKFLKSEDAVLDITFDMFFDADAAESDSLSCFFAMADDAENPLNGSWCYTFTKNGGAVEHYNADGTKAELTQNTCSLANLASDNGSRIQLKLTAGGTLIVFENSEEKMRFEGIDGYEGFCGFVATVDNQSKIQLDSVAVSEYCFEKVKTKSVSTNFSSNYFGPEGNEDFVYNADSGTIEVSNNELVLSRCSDSTYFGSAYKYDNFVAEFKMTSIYGGWKKGDSVADKMAANRWIGFDFGRKTATLRNYGTYGTLAVRVTHPTKNNDDNKDLVSNWKSCETFLYKSAGVSELTGEVVTRVNSIPSSYFQNITYDGTNTHRDDISADAAVCFKIVGEGNKISLYMKRADEGDYTLYVTVEGVKVSGYLAIVCTGYAYCSFDDFSITNTAEIYDIADTPVPDEDSGVTKTEIIYDRANNDVNWQEELDLNSGAASSGADIVWIVVVSVLGAVAVALAVLLFLSQKKRS